MPPIDLLLRLRGDRESSIGRLNDKRRLSERSRADVVAKRADSIQLAVPCFVVRSKPLRIFVVGELRAIPELDGPLHSITVAHARLIRPAEIVNVNGVLTLH